MALAGTQIGNAQITLYDSIGWFRCLFKESLVTATYENPDQTAWWVNINETIQEKPQSRSKTSRQEASKQDGMKYKDEADEHYWSHVLIKVAANEISKYVSYYTPQKRKVLTFIS